MASVSDSARRNSAGPSQLFEVFSRDSEALVPLGVCVDGAIFGQGLGAADQRTGATAGALEDQARACFAKMQELVQAGGCSLDNVGRVTSYVRSAEDREPLYALWDDLFPRSDDRPAFKVLTGPLPPGQLIRLDVIAVPGQTRRRIDIPGVEARDPNVLIGGWMFTSRLHAISPETGHSVEGLQAQLARATANARLLLELAGEPALEFVQLTSFGVGSSYRTGAREELNQASLSEPRKPATHVLESWVRPGAEAMLEAIALHRDDGREFRELFLSTEHSNQPTGFKFGRLVFAGGLSPVDPATGELAATDVEGQLRAVLGSMDRFLAIAGCSRPDVARISFYMRDLNDRPALNKVWQEWFPDPMDRPPHTYLPAALPEGQHVSIQVIALSDAQRRVLSVSGVEHGDPMSLAALVDNLLVSSRIFGGANSSSSDTLEVHTAKCFETVAALLTSAGGDWSSMQQLTVYASSPEFQSAVAQIVASVARGSPVRLEFRETDLGRKVLLPRLQLLGLVTQ